MSFTLPASSRLKLRSEINSLFAEHHTCSCFPLKCIYAEGEGEGQLLVSVPKRLFRRAVKRNLLKRRVREAYRTSREEMGVASYKMAFIYTSTKECTTAEIEKSIKTIFSKITSRNQ